MRSLHPTSTSEARVAAPGFPLPRSTEPIASRAPAAPSGPDSQRDRPVPGGDDCSGAGNAQLAWLPPRLLWADRAAIHLRQQLDRLTLPLAGAACRVVERRTWNVFGHARAEDHCRERYGRTARWLRDLAALGRGLEHLPGLIEALTGVNGGAPIGRTNAVLLTRVASARSAPAWIALARASSRREFAEAVRRARRAGSEWPVAAVAGADRRGRFGPLPSNPADPADPRGRFPSGPTGTSEPRDDDDLLAARSEVRLEVPAALCVAFDEVLDLHRAVSGGDVPLTDFIEALVAESMGGPTPVDVERFPLRPGRPVADVEHALARATGSWAALAHAAAPQDPLRGARDRRLARLHEETTRLLERLAAATVRTHDSSPAGLDRRIRELIRLEDRIEQQLGRLLHYISDQHAWLRLHFNGVGHYGAERLGLARRTAQDRAHAASVLRHFPVLREAYESRRLGLEAVLLVSRVLGPRRVAPWLERAWVDRAIEVSIKRLRDETRLALREGLLGVSGRAEPATDEAWLRSLGRFPGTTRRRFARLVGHAGAPRGCEVWSEIRLRLPEALAGDFLAALEDRRRTLSLEAARTVSAALDPVAVAEQEDRVGVEGLAGIEELVGFEGLVGVEMPGGTEERTGFERPNCDSHYEDLASSARSTTRPAARSARVACRLAAQGRYVPDTTAPSSETPHSRRAAESFVADGMEVPTWVGLMALLEEYVATCDPDERRLAGRQHAIHARHGMRCTAPGCTGRRHLEGHHIEYRSQGGGDEPSNLTSVCCFHHQRGEHGGLALCRGRAPLDIVWRLGRDDVGEWFCNERRVPAPAGAAADSALAAIAS